MRGTAGVALELASADRLDELLQLGPVGLVGDHHEPMGRRDLDDGALRAREQLRLSTAGSTCCHGWSPRATRCSTPTVAIPSDIPSRTPEITGQALVSSRPKSRNCANRKDKSPTRIRK